MQKNKAELNPFKTALAARQGDLPSESLSGAAKRIYDDNTLTNDMLEGYSNPVKENRSRSLVQRHSTYKY